MSPYRPQYANDECGRGTRGAWGAGTPPTVYVVSNLNDSGAGSLRAALEASGPRVVVFETSGAIIARSDYLIANPYCTVAGQTAPSPGITLQGDPSGAASSGGLSITGHDVVVQHLRVRPGDCPPVLAPTAAHDGIAIFYEGAYNVVIDHCSVSWVGGKTLQAFGIAQDAGVSFWRCIGAEALYYSANTDYSPDGTRESVVAGDAAGAELQQQAGDDGRGRLSAGALQRPQSGDSGAGARAAGQQPDVRLGPGPDELSVGDVRVRLRWRARTDGRGHHRQPLHRRQSGAGHAAAVHAALCVRDMGLESRVAGPSVGQRVRRGRTGECQRPRPAGRHRPVPA